MKNYLAPADPKPGDIVDFRFEWSVNYEPDQPGQGYFLRRIALVLAPADDQWPVETLVDGDVVETIRTDDPGAEIEAFREFQTTTLEESLGPYGLEWEREQRERQGVFA